MPLLKNRTLEKAPISEFLRDNEEVFHCEMTNEIFRDYDDFAEKTILCNSMVWTCSVTGKANLTYEEALRSETSAKKMLATFPEHMKIPLLYIASLTKRSSFKNMADDIFSFVKKRYFVGEQVEAMLVKRDWQTCKVVKVIAPSKEELDAYKKSPEGTSNSNSNETFLPPVLYKYKLMLMRDNAVSNVSETSIVSFIHIRRKHFSYTTESNKLFLKQYIEPSKGGNLVLKQSAIDHYKLNSVSFDAIFDGPGPEFKKNKIVRQETIASFLTKNKLIPKETNPETGKAKLSKSEIISMYKEWSTVKDDLLLEDQKIIPNATPITSLIPENYLGDAICILEFMAEFSTILETRNYFPGGMSFKEMERALLEKKPGSPLIDILQLMINTLFVMQENENARYKTTYKKKVDGISAINMESDLSLTDSSKLANVAYRWCWRHHGAALRDFPVLNLTVSEVLRLHLIMSGGVVSETCTSWRKANRGGFRSEDDPAILFRLQNPHIIKHLSMHSVVELPIEDKIKLVNCLMDQLLTYEEFRTATENVRENVRTLRIETKNLQVAEKKQIMESTDKINKLKKGGSFNPSLEKEIQDLETELENFKSDTEYKIVDNNLALIRSTTHLGYDRAFRRYIKLKSLKGLYVNSDELNAGTCLSEPTRQVPELVDAEKDDVLKYLSKSSEEMNTSDKENEPSVKKENGCSEANVEKGSSPDELMMCSSDPTTCVLHSKKDGSCWSFFTEREQLDELINSLNVRGIRESDLKEALANGQDFIARYIKTTPLKYYEDPKSESTKKGKSVTKNEDNFGYPDNMSIKDVMCTELVLTILEFEDKLYSGGIGGINHSMRAEWRELMEKMDFDKMDLTIHKHREYDDLVVNVSDEDEGEASDQIPEVVYKDPAFYLGKNKNSIETNGVVKEKEQQTIKNLATTLLQVAYTIFPDNLRRPMGRVVTKSANKLNNVFKNLILNWSTSLLASTSFSQLYLHFYTLDDCVMWNKSVSCQICRKAKNLTQLLLCDSCNSGYHLYCLKPKLAEVPEGEWFCKVCIKHREEEERKNSEAAIRKKEALERRKKRESGKLEKEAEEVEFGFGSDSNDEEEPVNCTKCGDFEGDEILKCDECPRAYHLLCLDPPLRRMPRGKWICNGCKELEHAKRYKSEPVEGIRRSNRREAESRSDLPLHNVALQELLVDVMKHKDAWPFTRPVQKIEVPDYYSVISKPMDFGTIKYKLNMGKYKYDAEFMADAQLVFGNCNAYNSSEAEVYKCGERLLKYFSKKCNELNLRRPSDMNISNDDDEDEEDDEQDEEPVNKRRRM